MLFRSNDDEIPPNEHGSTKALYITTKVKDCTLSKVLIDNGLSLNIMPLSTLTRLPVDRSYMRHTRTVVRAFDGTRWEVTGEIEIEMQIGPVHSLLSSKSWIYRLPTIAC